MQGGDPLGQAQKQASLKRAQQLAEQLKKIQATGGLHDLTVVELQEMAKAKGISLNMTKQDVIDLLNELEPRRRSQGAPRRAPDRRREKAPQWPAQEQAAARQGAGKGDGWGSGGKGQEGTA